MIICLCEGVSDREIALAVKTGATTLEQVAQSCRAGTSCGSCHDQIVKIIEASKDLEEQESCDIATPGVYLKCLNHRKKL